MDTDGGSEDGLARQVAERGWGRRDELSPVHLGLNRLTWKVGDNLWLTGIDDDRASLLERENRLLHAVGAACVDANVGIDIPRVVPTIAGDDVIRHGGHAFRATAHIDGARPDGDLAASYSESMRTLRRLHSLLRELPPDRAVLEPSLVEVRQMLTRCLSDHWDPVTTDPTERGLVNRAAEWLLPRIDRLDDAPAQLTHGDWATPNLLVGGPGRGHVVGVLDWQLCSVGPVIADVAQAVSGVLMFSQLAVDPVVDAIFASYGDGVDRQLLGPAMVAYWFRNYWWARDELSRDARQRFAVDRQPGRLRSVLEYVGGLEDD